MGEGWGGGEEPQLIELLQTILLPSLKVSYAVIANSKVSEKQDISSGLQGKINPVHPVHPVRKIDG